MAETELVLPSGPVELVRRHTPPNSPLRAWTAADELVLRDLDGADPGRLLIVGDTWGALAVGLARWSPTVWTDSVLARAAIDDNLRRNGSEPLGVRAVTGTAVPTGVFDTVVIAIPKSASLLAHQCRLLRGLVSPATTIIAAGMTKYLARAVWEALALLGDAKGRPAERKARLIDVVADERTGEADAETTCVIEAFHTDAGVAVHEAPGVFSAGHLDVGTALLLDHADDIETALGSTPQRCLDLGCGNGVIAATLAGRWPDSEWRLTDVSDLAVAAAEATWIASGHASDRAEFVVCDGVPERSDGFDLVVTNPPFHQGHAPDPALTERLMAEAAASLCEGGMLAVVAQRHLELHRVMRRHCTDVAAVSSRRSHVVIVARRRDVRRVP